MLLRPDLPKIKTVLSFIDQQVKSVGLSPLTNHQVYNILFVCDVIHLNKYGRPITFDTYRLTDKGLEAFCTSKFIGKDLEYNWDSISVSDTSLLKEAIHIVRVYGFNMIKTFVRGTHAYCLAQTKDKPTTIPLEDMFYETMDKEQRDERIFMIHNSMRSEDYNMNVLGDDDAKRN